MFNTRLSYCLKHPVISNLNASNCVITDSIEANVESAEVHVERGAEQLQRAAQYQVQQELQH